MTKLNIEPDKFYVIERKLYTGKETSHTSHIVLKILGLVDPCTLEYAGGGRYFGENETVFDSEGTQLFNLGIFIGRIIREATIDERRAEDHYKFATVSQKQVKDTKHYIPNTHPDFQICLGNTYVDRFGNLVFIRCERHKTSSDEIIFTGNNTIYSEKGLYQPAAGAKSMHDLVYMKINTKIEPYIKSPTLKKIFK